PPSVVQEVGLQGSTRHPADAAGSVLRDECAGPHQADQVRTEIPTLRDEWREGVGVSASGIGARCQVVQRLMVGRYVGVVHFERTYEADAAVRLAVRINLIGYLDEVGEVCDDGRSGAQL